MNLNIDHETRCSAPRRSSALMLGALALSLGGCVLTGILPDEIDVNDEGETSGDEGDGDGDAGTDSGIETGGDGDGDTRGDEGDGDGELEQGGQTSGRCRWSGAPGFL
jgi:hypothetical protein